MIANLFMASSLPAWRSQAGLRHNPFITYTAMMLKRSVFIMQLLNKSKLKAEIA
jgi:hypothetical protein